MVMVESQDTSVVESLGGCTIHVLTRRYGQLRAALSKALFHYLVSHLCWGGAVFKPVRNRTPSVSQPEMKVNTWRHPYECLLCMTAHNAGSLPSVLLPLVPDFQRCAEFPFPFRTPVS